jgi:hypothetical protein
LATNSTEVTTEPPAPPALPAAPALKHATLKFKIVYGILGLLAFSSLAAFVIFAFGLGLNSSPKWSSWKPDNAGPLVMAKQIANHVAPKYRLAGGGQLLAVVASAPAVTAGTQTVGIVAVSTQSKTGGKQSVNQLEPGGTVMYTLCGLGSHCAIATGKPTVARGELVRREGLEVALYTFKYIPSVNDVLIYVPPAQAQGAPAAPVLYFTRESLSGRLAVPVKETLPLASPPPAGKSDPTEVAVLDALTLPHFYASGLIQLQVGGALLALVHAA